MVQAAASSGEKKFLTFLINYVVDTSPGDLQTNLMHLSKHMQDNMETQCEENLYRKQYGNLKECVLAGATIMTVFKLDGTCFKFQKWEKIVAVNAAGNMESAAWERAQAGHVSYLTKHLGMCKQNRMNICKACEMKYHVAAEHTNCGANNAGAHTPQYNFELDEDVLNCEIH